MQFFKAVVAVVLFTVICCEAALAAETAVPGERALAERYAAIRSKLEKNQFGAPIYLESKEGDDSVRVDMYGVFRFPFEAVRDALRSPAAWCEITPLHINIKACTYKTGKGHDEVTMYSGRKYYQPPSDAYPLKLAFHVASADSRYLKLDLRAEEGPLGTKDHHIRVEAVPLEGEVTFLHFGYTYHFGTMARIAIKTYFATVGREKEGFTLVGEDGKQTYIQGPRGAVERNTMRYYLALQAYLETLKYPEKDRFEQRISRWFDLTSKYPRQLKEMDKPAYLKEKRLERENQEELQARQGKKGTSSAPLPAGVSQSQVPGGVAAGMTGKGEL